MPAQSDETTNGFKQADKEKKEISNYWRENKENRTMLCVVTN